MKDLSGYTPEKPGEGGAFEAFKYTGKATIEKAQISEYMGESTDFYQNGDKQIELEVTCMEDKPYKGQQTLGRKLWKRYNLDSENEDKKGKTPVMKLADQLFALGFKFNSLEELQAVCEKLVDLDVIVKAWPADFKDGRDPVQLFNFKGLASDAPAEKPSTKQVAF